MQSGPLQRKLLTSGVADLREESQDWLAFPIQNTIPVCTHCKISSFVQNMWLPDTICFIYFALVNWDTLSIVDLLFIVRNFN